MNDLSISSLRPPDAIQNAASSARTADPDADFGAALTDAIRQVSDLQAQAGDDVQNVLTGDSTDIHSAMIAVQKADISFQMMMQVRNKIVSAYQEIMRMQI